MRLYSIMKDFLTMKEYLPMEYFMKRYDVSEERYRMTCHIWTDFFKKRVSAAHAQGERISA